MGYAQRSQRGSREAEATLTTRTGRVFAAIQIANNHTSPRVGCILILVEQGEHRFAGFANLLVRNRAGVKRHFAAPAHDFHDECLPVVSRRRVKGIQKPDASRFPGKLTTRQSPQNLPRHFFPALSHFAHRADA